jgi:hypothetical protein
MDTIFTVSLYEKAEVGLAMVLHTKLLAHFLRLDNFSNNVTTANNCNI